MESEREQALRSSVRAFAERSLKPLAAEVDDSYDISWEVVRLMADEGLFKYLIPKEYGGNGLQCVNLCILREELAAVCVQADDTLAMQGLGSYPVIKFGSESQKQRFLPPLAAGTKLGSLAMSEPNCGSDVASLETTARLDDGHYVINGTKLWISNGAGAEVCPTFVRTGDVKGSKGLSAIVVDAKNAGAALTCTVSRLFMAHPGFSMVFNDLRVPAENLLGEPGMGMKIAMTNLDMYRVTVGAMALGFGRGAFEEALRFVRERVAFNKRIIENQAIQFKLAEMATNLEAARALVLDVARKKDANPDDRGLIKLASMAKLFSSEVCWQVADDAAQMHGARGFLKGSHIEQAYTAARLTRILEGTSEIQKLTISRMLMNEVGLG